MKHNKEDQNKKETAVSKASEHAASNKTKSHPPLIRLTKRELQAFPVCEGSVRKWTKPGEWVMETEADVFIDVADYNAPDRYVSMPYVITSWKKKRLQALKGNGYLLRSRFQEPLDFGWFSGADAYCPEKEQYLMLMYEITVLDVMYALALKRNQIRSVIIMNNETVDGALPHMTFLMKEIGAFIEHNGELYEPVTKLIDGKLDGKLATNAYALEWFNAYSQHLEKKAA